MQIVTIGGYGFTEDRFLEALKRAQVDTFVDIRQRRGMRGARYAFLNSSRLQAALASLGIRYVHALDLAPTTSVREIQKNEDSATGTSKRERTQLSDAFVEKYHAEVLGRLNIAKLRAIIDGARVAALFCVETNPAACHRCLAAEYLTRAFGIEESVEHLRP